MLWCTCTLHTAHATASQRAAGAPARLGGRIRPHSRRPHVQNMLVRRGSNKHQPRQAHSERLCGTCTHATTLRGHASRGHGRTACTQEHRLWPMGARPRPGRHAAIELTLSSLPMSLLSPHTRLHLLLLRASTAARCVDRRRVASWRRQVAAWPHRRVRGASRGASWTYDALWHTDTQTDGRTLKQVESWYLSVHQNTN